MAWSGSRRARRRLTRSVDSGRQDSRRKPRHLRKPVPVQDLVDCLPYGHTLDEFLEDFPAVSREQVVQVLRLAQEALVAGAHPS